MPARKSSRPLAAGLMDGLAARVGSSFVNRLRAYPFAVDSEIPIPAAICLKRRPRSSPRTRTARLLGGQAWRPPRRLPAMSESAGAEVGPGRRRPGCASVAIHAVTSVRAHVRGGSARAARQRLIGETSGQDQGAGPLAPAPRSEARNASTGSPSKLTSQTMLSIADARSASAGRVHRQVRRSLDVGRRGCLDTRATPRPAGRRRCRRGRAALVSALASAGESRREASFIASGSGRGRSQGRRELAHSAPTGGCRRTGGSSDRSGSPCRHRGGRGRGRSLAIVEDRSAGPEEAPRPGTSHLGRGLQRQLGAAVRGSRGRRRDDAERARGSLTACRECGRRQLVEHELQGHLEAPPRPGSDARHDETASADDGDHPPSGGTRRVYRGGADSALLSGLSEWPRNCREHSGEC